MACGSRSGIFWLFCRVLAYTWVLGVARREQWDWFHWRLRSFVLECRSPANLPFESNVTGLRAILASVGQTGTTSMTDALRELGLRTYHADDVSMVKSMLKDKINPVSWAETVSRCRMEAVSLEPPVDMLPLALSVSPRAKVILTWRDYPSWQRSTSTGGVTKDKRASYLMGMVTSARRVLPWIELLDHFTGVILRVRLNGDPFSRPPQAAAFLYRLLCSGYAWPANDVYSRGVFKCSGQEEAYLAHIDEIRRITPPGRLLEVDVKKFRWRELEEFLGLPPTKGDGRLPKARSSWLTKTHDPFLDSGSPQVLLGLGVLCSAHAAGFWAAGLLVRAPLLLCAGLCSCCCGLTSVFVRAVSYPVLALCGLRSRR
mmetsp:Transcript_85751/g.270294  ORF Transcript_85751/g.270294 Transcript_85751/m.270294 type:complete len:372 (-) Transcript_85751:125-1240(-)